MTTTERDRLLRRITNAVISARLDGVDEHEIQQAVQAGVEQAGAEQALRRPAFGDSGSWPTIATMSELSAVA